jgi:hypothetical protein
MSYRAVIRAKGDSRNIVAPVYFQTHDEAVEFGRVSVDVLGYYLQIEKWRVEECSEPPNHALVNGRLHQISAPC